MAVKLQVLLDEHVRQLAGCSACATMVGPVVAPPPVMSPIYLLGQAPGPHEGKLGRPFAWTAGKTLFKWFETLGVDEASFRQKAYMAAVCRCFPGKAKPGGGDRVPSPLEIGACSRWMQRELEILRPRLVVPVGKLAIATLLGEDRPLVEVIGRATHKDGRDIIPLPHPSGASTWFRMSPGAELTRKALRLLGRHEAWRAVFG